MNKTYLIHHGIKGQTWGVRQAEWYPIDEYKAAIKRKDSVIKKGTKVYRVGEGITNSDPQGMKRKYVSIDSKDTKKWENYFKTYDNQSGKGLNTTTYRLNHDIKVASPETQIEVYEKLRKNRRYRKTTDAEVQKIKDNNAFGYFDGYTDVKYIPTEMKVSRLIGLGAPSTEKYFKELKKMGYGALVDSFGYDIASNPIIILDPDDNMGEIYCKKIADQDAELLIKNAYMNANINVA